MTSPTLPVSLSPEQIEVIDAILVHFADERAFKAERRNVVSTLENPPCIWLVWDPRGNVTRRLCVMALEGNLERGLYFVPQSRVLLEPEESWQQDLENTQRFPLEALVIPTWPKFGEHNETNAGAWVSDRVANDSDHFGPLCRALSDRVGWAWYGYKNYEPRMAQDPTRDSRPNPSP